MEKKIKQSTSNKIEFKDLPKWVKFTIGYMFVNVIWQLGLVLVVIIIAITA